MTTSHRAMPADIPPPLSPRGAEWPWLLALVVVLLGALLLLRHRVRTRRGQHR